MQATSKWFPARTGTVESRLRLFCLPHAGSGAAAYYTWKQHLPSSVEVVPILLPGRDARLAEPCCTDSDLLPRQIADAIAPLLDRPYAIFGHSMGALLAFELAQRLRGMDLPAPDCLFVSGRIAPHLPLPHQPIHQLPDEDFIAQLGSRYGGLPRELLLSPDLLKIYLPILRADMMLLERHRHIDRPALGCAIAAFAGEQDANVSADAIHAWARHTTGKFSVRRFPGDHFYLTGASRNSLLDALSGAIAALQATASSAHPSI